MEKFSLKGKVAVVTGGAGILGTHFCRALSQAGAAVCVVDLDHEKSEDLARMISQETRNPLKGFGCDITEPEQVRELIVRVKKEFSAIHILHNNAASKSSDLDQFFAPFETFSLKTWREVTSVNIDAMFLVAQAVGRQMIEQGTGGSIIQTASIYGVVAPDQRIYEGSLYNGRPINTPAVYSASKAAVIGLTQYLSTYWAPHRIRVNTLTPGGIESGQNEEFKRRYSNRVPLARMGSADELTGALIYLASDASSYVTGQNLIIDGGLSVW